VGLASVVFREQRLLQVLNQQMMVRTYKLFAQEVMGGWDAQRAVGCERHVLVSGERGGKRGVHKCCAI
jgi:hypothetical protein